MKKKSSVRGAFFNVRVLVAIIIVVLGLTLAIFAARDGVLLSRKSPSRTVLAAAQPARYMPVPGRDAREEASGLARLEQYWNDRLTFPTGRFNPAWVRAAAREHARMPRGVPFGQRDEAGPG
jgi:hypothetical protein